MQSFNLAATPRGQDGMMTVGTDYSTPVTVNGFSCRNCTDVDYAKKHIDPAHPKAGPYGIDAKDDPTVKKATDSAVTFGGTLRDQGVTAEEKPAPISPIQAGAQLDISA